MQQVARVGDIGVGVCKVHGPQTGVIKSGSNDVFCDGGIKVARKGDLVVAGCGHSGKMMSVSKTVFVNGRGIARVGDLFVGVFTGTIRNGSLTTFSG